MKFVVRTARDPTSLATGVRSAVWLFDKDQPVGHVATMAQLVHEADGGDVVISTLMLVFGVMALVLAAIGIYGVVAYAVAQSTREIGIRMALGAQRTEVLRSVLKQGMLPAAMGGVFGLIASMPLPGLFATMFQVWRVHSGPIFVSVPALLFVVAVAAVLVPAARAVKIDPMEALRHD